MLPHIELAIGNHRVRPTGAITAPGNRKRPDFDVLLGAGFGEHHSPIRKLDVEPPICRNHRCRALARAAFLPFHLAGQQVRTVRHTGIIRIPIQVIAHEHDPAMLVRQLGLEGIQFLDVDCPISSRNLL